MYKLYCSDCGEITNHTPKLSAVMSGNLVCEICSRMNPFCELVKVGDDFFSKTSYDFRWVEFDDKGFGLALHTTPKIGYSLLMAPFNPFSFTWQTTGVTEILSISENEIHFKTKNSEYILKYNKEVIEEYAKKK